MQILITRRNLQRGRCIESLSDYNRIYNKNLSSERLQFYRKDVAKTTTQAYQNKPEEHVWIVVGSINLPVDSKWCQAPIPR